MRYLLDLKYEKKLHPEVLRKARNHIVLIQKGINCLIWFSIRMYIKENFALKFQSVHFYASKCFAQH